MEPRNGQIWGRFRTADPVTWPGAAGVIEAIAADVARGAVSIVVGVPATGARELVDGALRRPPLATPPAGGDGDAVFDPDAGGASSPSVPAASPWIGSLDEIGAALIAAPPAGTETASSARGWIERVARAARRLGVPVVFELADDPRAEDLVSALARADGDGPAIAIVDVPPRGGPRPELALHVAPGLDDDGVAALAGAMLGAAPPRPWAHALRMASGGLPVLVIELVRWIAGEPQPFSVDWTARTAAGMAELRARQLRTASPGARRVALATAAWGGRVRIDRVLASLRGDGKVAATLGDVAELERAGLGHRRGDTIAIDRAIAEAAEAIAGRDALARFATAALDAVRTGEGSAASDPRSAEPVVAAPGSDPARSAISAAGRARLAATGELYELAPLLEHAALDTERAELACDVADDLLARGRADRALGLARRALPIAPARAGLIAARAAAATGAYREAAAHARDAEAAGADAVAAQLVAARAAQLGGELDAAEAGLAALFAAHPEHTEVAGSYARLLVTRSRYREAREVAAVCRPLAGLAAEAGGLAAFHLGELDASDAAFAALEVGAAASGDGATAGRASSLRGMVAQQRGQLGLASDRYREAVRRLGEAGEVHAAATAELNLGSVLAERGRASDALPRLVAAGRVFAELGAAAEWCAAELHRGRALLRVGKVEDARTAAEAALAPAAETPELRAFALIVAGDARRRLGDEPGAIASYREALAIAAQRGDGRAQISAHVALAEAGQCDGDPAAIEALCASDDDRDRWTLARGRLALRDPSSVVRTAPRSIAAAGLGAAGAVSAAGATPVGGARSAAAPGSLGADSAGGARSPGGARSAGASGSLAEVTAALAKACGDVALRAGEADRLERGFRGHAIAAQLAQRARDFALARSEAERARVAHAAWSAATAPAHRAAIDGDPDLARLAGTGNAGSPGAGAAGASRGAEPGGTAPGSRGPERQVELRRLLTLSRRLHSEASIERILDEVIDTAIELTGAERGFVLLRQPAGELAAVVSRNFLAGELEPRPADGGGGPSPSRSIAERAALTGEPVVTVEAGVDDRSGAAASPAVLRPRSVLAVPLRQRGTVTGCLYVDHRLRGGAFDAAAAGVVSELADSAAIAIENARLTGELRRTAREVDARNARLSVELAERDAELVRVKAELPDRDRLRHRYERIVGRSPAMVKMLGLIDRAAATSLPVVIVGESGTGKELVARALHDHGPRSAGAFVAVNCAAVPEPLLESELFGHVRGSFAGAERDRCGLFEVAHDGTLVFDEIAETSPAMQAKLLRVLQDGMIRRVGDSRPRPVDVRVVVASQQPLAQLVAAGRFREDLRLRIDVITVPVPALRERDGDLPLLVEHLLARLAAGRPAPRLTRAALRALGQHRWPGNVRELENALARGVALGGDVIDVEDLPEAIGRAIARPEPVRPAVGAVGEDLRLRPALAATEQAYLAAAMARAKGNQTAAARLLGLSRFGLQKKLRRLAGAARDDDDDDAK